MGLLHLGDQPLPEVQRLGVRVVDPEDRHPGRDPVLDQAQALGVDPGRVVVEVDRVDVLVLLGRVLGVGDRAVGLGREPLRVRRDPGMVGRGLQGEVQRDLEVQLAGPAHERGEVGHRAQLGMDGVVPAVARADGPGRADVPRRGHEGVVRALAVHLADRVDGRQVDHVEAERGDVVEMLGGVLERAVAGRARGCGLVTGQLGADGAGEELVPGAVERPLAVDPERVRRRAGDELAHRVRVHQVLQEVVERGRDPVGQVEGGVAQGPGRGQGPRPFGLGQGLGQLVEQPGPGLEVVGEVLAALPGVELGRDRVVPGAERVAPPLDRERPQARAVGDDGGVPAVGARVAGGHPLRGSGPPVGAADHDAGAHGVVSLAEHHGRNRYRLAHDGPRGKLRGDGGTDDRRDVAEPDSSYHVRHRTQPAGVFTHGRAKGTVSPSRKVLAFRR